MSLNRLNAVTLFMLMTGISASFLWGGAVIAKDDANPDVYESTLRISPPPPGPWVSQSRAAMRVPQYVVGSYRPMDEFATDEISKQSVQHDLIPQSDYLSGPSSADIYGVPISSQKLQRNRGYSLGNEMSQMYSEPSAPNNNVQPVPGAYRVQPFKSSIDNNPFRNYQYNFQQPSLPPWSKGHR